MWGVAAPSRSSVNPGHSRVVAFGAFDRHNFGDLLFPHLLQAMLPDCEVAAAALVRRDLRALGGHRVAPLPSVLRRHAPVRAVVHAGGEVLTCDAWQAAAMLLPGDDFESTVRYLERRPQARRAWARGVVGSDAHAPYVASPVDLGGIPAAFAGVGGFDLDRADPALRAEVLDRLRQAAFVGVRDERTLAHLCSAGVAATLMPDPAVMLPDALGDVIARRATRGEVARLRRRHRQGWLAVQCSAEFGDDATRAALASAVEGAARRLGLPVVLFRAGAAPWHDDSIVLARLASLLRGVTVETFDSIHVWDIAALLAACRACMASSLHAVLVARAFARPALALNSPWLRGAPGKADACLRTWPVGPVAPTASPADALSGLEAVMARPWQERAAAASRDARRYVEAFALLLRAVGLSDG